MRILLIALLVCGVVAGALYASAPHLIRHAAVSQMTSAGLSDIAIEPGYPQLDHLQIAQVSFVITDQRITAAQIELSWELGDLIDGRLQSIHVGQLLVEQQPHAESTDTAHPSNSPTEPPEPHPDTDPDPETDTDLNLDIDLNVAPLFDALPFTQANVEEVTVNLISPKFTGRGMAHINKTRFELLLTGEAPEAMQGFSLKADLQNTSRLQFKLDAPQAGDYLALSAIPMQQNLSVEGNMQLSQPTIEFVSAFAPLPEGKARLAGSFKSDIPWPLPQNLTETLDWLSLDMTLSNSRWASPDSTQKITVDSTNLKISNGALEGGSNIAFELTGDSWVVKGQTKNLSGQLTPTIQLDYSTSLQLEADAAKFSGAVQGAIKQVSPHKTTGSYLLQGVSTLEGRKYPSTQIDGTFSLDGSTAALQGSAQVHTVKDIQFDAEIDPTSLAGRLSMKAQHQIQQPLANSLLPVWNEAYDLTSGTLDVDIQSNWQSTERIPLNIEVNIKNADAVYEDLLATGISGQASIKLPDLAAEEWQMQSAGFNINQVDVGFLIEDIRLPVRATQNQAKVGPVSAQLLGGNASIPVFAYAFDTERAAPTIQLDGLNLTQILELEGEDVTGTGTIDGVIPLLVEGDKFSVSTGRFEARPPGGVLNLSPTLTGTGNPSVDFALTALYDYRFSKMTGDIDYSTTGDLKLAVQLLGFNPAVEKGRAIQYNLNISENIPTLLASLRLQDSVNERIEKKVEQQSKKP